MCCGIWAVEGQTGEWVSLEESDTECSHFITTLSSVNWQNCLRCSYELPTEHGICQGRSAVSGERLQMKRRDLQHFAFHGLSYWSGNTAVLHLMSNSIGVTEVKYEILKYEFKEKVMLHDDCHHSNRTWFYVHYAFCITQFFLSDACIVSRVVKKNHLTDDFQYFSASVTWPLRQSVCVHAIHVTVHKNCISSFLPFKFAHLPNVLLHKHRINAEPVSAC
jgi:hypothetical protein